jgi:hypothetical protein
MAGNAIVRASLRYIQATARHGVASQAFRTVVRSLFSGLNVSMHGMTGCASHRRASQITLAKHHGESVLEQIGLLSFPVASEWHFENVKDVAKRRTGAEIIQRFP